MGETDEEWIYPADAFTSGVIGGRTVACLSGEQQMRDHAFGYEPVETDHADMRALHELLGTGLLGPYGEDPPRR